MSVAKVIFWRGWAIRTYGDGRWMASKKGCTTYSGSFQIGRIIESILRYEGIYK